MRDRLIWSTRREGAKALRTLIAFLSAVFGIALPSAVSAADALTALSEAMAPAPPAPPPLPLAQPQGARLARGFDVSGLVQKTTVTPCQPNAAGVARTPGGSVWINSNRYEIPCNTMVLLPGTTLSWGEIFGGANETLPVLAPAGSAATQPSAFSHNMIGIRLVGNVVDGAAIAGLVTIGQHAAIKGAGYIASIDFKAGRLGVSSTPAGANVAILELNDPIIADLTDPAFGKGRFSSGQSLDPRFSTDQSNQMVRAATGYPMCIPRTDPAIADDPLCPARNRPASNSPSCRALAQAGIATLNGRQLASVATSPGSDGAWCSSFVMKYPPGTRLDQHGNFMKADGSIVVKPGIATPAEPDARHMAPLKIGDFITYSGIGLIADGVRSGPAEAEPISVHAIEANVGIYTAPGSLPVYAAIKDVTVAADAAATTHALASGTAQDVKLRISLEAVVTDVTAIADVYFVDLEPGANMTGFPRQGRSPGQEAQRWVTPAAITGEIGAVGSNGFQIGGGITTQQTDPRPGHIQLQAAKVNTGVLVAPTRYARLVVRSLCDPSNINGRAEIAPANGTAAACLKRARVPSGLYSGHYLAPIEHIFADNALPGDPVLAKNLWSLGFLANGEGGRAQEGESLAPGALLPTPW